MRVPCFEVSSVAFSKVLELLRVLFEYSVPLVLMWILGSTCVLLTATTFCTEASQLRVAGIVQQIPMLSSSLEACRFLLHITTRMAASG